MRPRDEKGVWSQDKKNVLPFLIRSLLDSSDVS
jgi:hypothetical protein